MPKILYIIDTLNTGGAEKSILEISTRLSKYKPTICILFNSDSPLIKEYQKAGIELHFLGLKKSDRLWLLKAMIRYRNLLSKLKPDIIHAHLFKSEMAARLATPGLIPLIGAFVNDSYSIERYAGLKWTQKAILNLYKLSDSITAKRVFHFTSVSRSILESNCKALHYNPQKVTVFYRGRDKHLFHNKTLPFDKSQSKFQFIVVARLLKRKGYIELIKAATILKEKRPHSFVIKIAGTGVEEIEIKAFASSQNTNEHIEFLGNSNKIPELLSQSNCFVFASHYEGQGGALVEAMFSAKPIIATDIPVFSEQVTNGKTALLFRKYDYEDLASKMLWMMDNHNEAILMGMNARKKAEELFDIEKIADAHDSFYEIMTEKFIQQKKSY